MSGKVVDVNTLNLVSVPRGLAFDCFIWKPKVPFRSSKAVKLELARCAGSMAP